MNAKQLGRTIRKFREEAGLSQQLLAEQLNISFQQLQKYEYGQSRITVDRLLEIARILHTSIADMIAHSSDDPLNAAYSAETGRFDPFERVLVSPEESQLLKVFRRIHTEKVRSILIQEAKMWAETEKELLNRPDDQK
jgi:transcriptional regulator with XRE-family HTH domain